MEVGKQLPRKQNLLKSVGDKNHARNMVAYSKMSTIQQPNRVANLCTQPMHQGEDILSYSRSMTPKLQLRKEQDTQE